MSEEEKTKRLSERYLNALEERMEKGRREYGEKSWSRDPIELIEEMQQEIVDQAGWGGILWERWESLKEHLVAIQAADKKSKPL